MNNVERWNEKAREFVIDAALLPIYGILQTMLQKNMLKDEEKCRTLLVTKKNERTRRTKQQVNNEMHSCFGTRTRD